MALVRRLWLFMAASALLNLAALALLGEFWRPLPDVPPLPEPKLLLLTLLPPVPKVKPSLRSKPKPPAPKRQPRVMATPLPPMPHRTVKIASVSLGGGSPPKPRPRPKQAHKYHLLERLSSHAELPINDKTFHADTHEDDQDDMDTNPNQGQKPDTGHTDSHAPGTGDTTKGDGGTGTGPVGPGPGLFDSAEPGGGSPGNGGGGSALRHIVYVLDISGSMNMTEAKFHGRTRIAQARGELDKQLKALSDGETFSLIAFSDDVHTFRRELVKPDPDTLKSAESFLDGLKPDGDTDLESALKAALAMPDVNIVVAITDGVPRTPEVDYETQEDFDKLASRIDAADSAKVPIYAYGLLGPNPDGTDDSKEAASFLTQIAADNNGKFVEVKLDGEGR